MMSHFIRALLVTCLVGFTLLLSSQSSAQIYEVTTTSNQEVFADLVVDLSSPTNAQQNRTTWGGITGYWVGDGCGVTEELTFTFTPEVSSVELAMTAASMGPGVSDEEIAIDVNGSPYTLLLSELDNTVPSGGSDFEIVGNRLRAIGDTDDARGTYTVSGPITSLTVHNIWLGGCSNGTVFEVTAFNPFVCGNGVLQGLEECDDGNLSDNDDCLTSCLSPTCGDGFIHNQGSGTEICDDGNLNDNDDCPSSCLAAVCGDGFVHDQGSGTEACDDGNLSDNDDCVSCAVATCGDGFVHDQGSGSEQCDDGNANSDTEPNACRLSCEDPSCGDGVTDAGETCDDGSANSDTEPDACRLSCALPTCGDGVLDSGELCDLGADNDDLAVDGCRTTCVDAYCGDSVVDTGEACDDGADNSDTVANACRESCVAAGCGDGVVDTGEECDDGNLSGGDGCGSDCQDEGTSQGGGGSGAGGQGGSGAGGADPIDDGPSGSPVDEGGCGCRVAGAGDARGWAAALLLLLAAAWRRRR